MPSISDQVRQRFQVLEDQTRTISTHRHEGGGTDSYADPERFYAWASSALTAIQDTFGIDSPYYISFRTEMDGIKNNLVWSDRFSSIRGIFQGAKRDVDSGYVFDLQRRLSGEVFGDFVGAAKSALAEGHHTVAAVLACAALEDALKRYAIANRIKVEGQTMETVVNALKGASLVGGAQKSLLAAMPKVRNFAMHADWDSLSPQDAGSVIGFVENFLLEHF